jgi:hypothetical protein
MHVAPAKGASNVFVVRLAPAAQHLVTVTFNLKITVGLDERNHDAPPPAPLVARHQSPSGIAS